MKWILAVIILLVIFPVATALVGTASQLDVNGGTIQELEVGTLNLPSSTVVIKFSPSELETKPTGNLIIGLMTLPAVEQFDIVHISAALDLNANGVFDQDENAFPFNSGETEIIAEDYADAQVVRITINLDSLLASIDSSIKPTQLVLMVNGTIGSQELIGTGKVKLY